MVVKTDKNFVKSIIVSSTSASGFCCASSGATVALGASTLHQFDGQIIGLDVVRN
jgi:hypothetical protein